MAAFQFGILEDIALMVASLVSVSLGAYRHRKLQKIPIEKILIV
jgi:hypothetical protein